MTTKEAKILGMERCNEDNCVSWFSQETRDIFYANELAKMSVQKYLGLVKQDGFANGEESMRAKIKQLLNIQ